VKSVKLLRQWLLAVPLSAAPTHTVSYSRQTIHYHAATTFHNLTVQALVSGQFLNTSFAGPRYIRAPQQPAASTAAAAVAAAAAAAAALPSTWWQLDLGPQHRLLCNYYTIRHDGSQDGFVRSWVLQVTGDLLGLEATATACC
jgi:hypothetical protein